MDYKKLGFKSGAELELYEDVCCELTNVKDLDKKEDVIKLLKRVNNIDVITKKEYEEFINKKGLDDLLEKVRPMSLLDRYVELYIYHINCYMFHTSLMAMGINDAKNNRFSEDIEKYIKILQNTLKENQESATHLYCIKYIFNKVHTRIPFLEDMFYSSINNIHNNTYLGGNNGENGKELD